MAVKTLSYDTLMLLNWNRISELTHEGNKTAEIVEEISERVNFHNNSDFKAIKKSLTPKIEKSVRRFMKRKNVLTLNT
ncbi:MAG: hypothetical protein ABFD07_00320 [Methanobacterium sp.]